MFRAPVAVTRSIHRVDSYTLDYHYIWCIEMNSTELAKLILAKSTYIRYYYSKNARRKNEIWKFVERKVCVVSNAETSILICYIWHENV